MELTGFVLFEIAGPTMELSGLGIFETTAAFDLSWKLRGLLLTDLGASGPALELFTGIGDTLAGPTMELAGLFEKS